MAGDTLMVNEGDLRTFNIKVHRVRGCLVGFSGDFYAAHLFLEWFERGERRIERPGISDGGDISIMLVDPEGSLFTCDGNYILVHEPLEYFAIGTGAPYAMSGMRLGLSAEEAVKHAIEFDINSGGMVTVERL